MSSPVLVAEIDGWRLTRQFDEAPLHAEEIAHPRWPTTIDEDGLYTDYPFVPRAVLTELVRDAVQRGVLVIEAPRLTDEQRGAIAFALGCIDAGLERSPNHANATAAVESRAALAAMIDREYAALDSATNPNDWAEREAGRVGGTAYVSEAGVTLLGRAERCSQCGISLNDGEGRCFTLCDECFSKRDASEPTKEKP